MPGEDIKSGRPVGGNMVEKLNIDRNKPIKIDPDYVFPVTAVKEVDNTIKKYRCCMCGTVYKVQKGNFPAAGKSQLFKGNNGYLPFCRSCVETLFECYTNFYCGNEEHALRHICQMFDWYYSPFASSMTIKKAKLGKSRVGAYPGAMQTTQVARKGTCFADTMVEEQMVTNWTPVIENEDGTISENHDEDEFVVTKEIMKFWGKGFKADQYEFLESEYKDWCTKNVCNTKSQQEIYKNIALAQLNIRIAQQTGGKVVDAQKALQDLMSSAAILPKQTADNVLADTQTFGTLLKKYEDSDPIPEPDERWKDVDGIRKYMNAWFRGGLAKALKIKNENSELYDEEVDEYKKYTVEKKTVDEQEDVSGYASIFDTDKKEET